MAGIEVSESNLVAQPILGGYSSDDGSNGANAQDASETFEDWLQRAEPLDQATEDFTPSYDPEPTRSAVISFDGTLNVDGYLAGSVRSEHGTLIVTENGELEAEVNVAEAIINGAVNGQITATRRIELRSTARVIGSIQTPGLSIHHGAILEGDCHFTEPASTEQTPSAGVPPSDVQPAPSPSPKGRRAKRNAAKATAA
jgi:cytoskeletal protein CcmA (bactofilin family)